MNRLLPPLLIGATLIASWLGMQVFHEAGHAVAGWLSGGTIERVVLHPLTLSRTDLTLNPHPGLVVWAGPICGVLAPLLCYLAAWRLKRPSAFVWRFFAGFALIANGAYIGLGAWERIGDCGEMLRTGSPVWTLWLFGAVTVPLGLWLWHQQGQHFGLGRHARKIEPGVVIVTIFMATFLAINGWLTSFWP